MAGRTITQRIALDGGAQIKTQLEQIGVAAQAAFDKFAAASGQTAALTKVGDAVAVLQTRVRALGASASDVGDNFNQFGNAAQRAGRNIGLIGLAVGGAVAGFAALFKSAGDSQEQLQNTADLLNTNSENYQAVRNAAAVSGVENGVFDKSILHLVNTMRTANQQSEDYRKKVNALNRDLGRGKIDFTQYSEQLQTIRDGLSDSSNAFKDLGVSITENGGKLRDPLAVANDIGDSLKGLPEGADKAAKSLELFGTRNAKFGAFVSQGAQGVGTLALAAHRLAPALDKDASAAVDRAGDSFTKLGMASAATKNQILAVFAPNVSKLVEAYTEAVVRGRAAWVSYAQTIEAKVRPIVNDIVAVLEGRNADVKNSFILQARDAFVQFGADARDAVFNIIIPALKALLAILQQVADAINAVFGTKLSGGQLAIALVLTKLIGLFGVFTSAVRLAWSVGVLLFNSLSVLAGGFGVLARVVQLAAGLLVAAFGAVPIAIAAIGFAIGFLAVAIVQKLGGVTGIIAKVQAAFATFGVFVQGIAASIGSAFVALWSVLTSGVASFVASVIAWFARLPSTLVAIFGAIVAVAQAAWTAIMTAGGGLIAGITESFNGMIALIVAGFIALPETLLVIFTAIVTAVTTAWGAIQQGASNVVSGIISAFKSGIDTVIGFFTNLLNRALNIFKAIIEGAKAAAAAVASATGGGGGGKTPGFASGGHVRGAGSGTSDSIWARISNGEFVQRAAAVRKYGVSFMNALNQGRLSVDKIRGIMSGVSVSGLADSLGANLMPAVPRYRDGGLVGAGVGMGGDHRPFNLFLPNGQVVGGMTANGDAVEQLQRYASGKQIRSAGRKPTWFKG